VRVLLKSERKQRCVANMMRRLRLTCVVRMRDWQRLVAWATRAVRQGLLTSEHRHGEISVHLCVGDWSV
jgi:hypothetical protein